MFAQLDRIGAEDVIFGVKDEAGRVTAKLKDGSETQVLVQQIAENPSRYDLTEKQILWLNTAQEINQAPKRILEAHGQKVHDYQHDSEFFVGRVIVGKYNATGEVVELGYVPLSDKRGFAGRAGTVKARAFDTIEDAVKAGFAPEPSYSRTLLLRSRSAGREAVNIRVGHWLAQQIRRGTEGLQAVPREGLSRVGQQDIDLLVDVPRRGVQPRTFRIEGPEAQLLKEFTERIAHEGELREANVLVQRGAKISGALRFLQLTADTSVLVIQGLTSWASRPLATGRPFVRAAREGLQALKNPDGIRQARAAAIDDFARNGGFERHPNLITDYGGFSEFTEAAGGFAGRIPIAGEGFQRFALMFDHVRDMMALSHANIVDELAAAKNLDGLAKQQFIDSQDAMTNMMLGRMRTAALGITSNQRQVEATLFLAPQYYRSTIGMFAMALEGGVRGSVARRLLMKSLGTLMLLTATANYVHGRTRGESHDQSMAQTLRSINPTSREFASMRLDLPGEADIRIGLGGSVRAVLSLIAEMAIGEESGTGQEAFDREGFDRVTMLRRFGEARFSPVLSLGRQVGTNEDFIGRNTNLSTPRGILRLATNNLLPIFLQNAVDDFDFQNLWRTGAITGFGALGLNARDLGTQDVREWAARSLYNSANYNDLESWEQDYVKFLAQPELQRLYEQRAKDQASGVSSADLGLRTMEARTEREQSLLGMVFNPTMEPFQKYTAWKSADNVEWGRRVERGKDYDLIFGGRSDYIPKTELEKAYVLWQQVLDLEDENEKQAALANFEKEYPEDSEVGQYIRRQTNRRRVPIVLLRQLENYARSKGVIASASARAFRIFQRVSEEEGPEAAIQKQTAYLRWFYMMDEVEARMEELNSAA